MRVLLVLAVALIAALAVVVVRGRPSEPPSAPGAGAASREAGGSATLRRTEGTAEPLAAPERSELTAARAGADVASGDLLRVRVVDARSLRPVAGAVVRALATADEGALQSSSEADFETLATELGTAATTSDDGIARLPRPRHLESYRHRVYVARAGDRYGEAVLGDLRAELLEISLDADRSARFLVVDAAGAPAAGVRIQHEVRRPGGGLGTNALRVLVRTGDDGIAVIPHTQLRVLDARQVSAVAVDEPGIDVPAAPFDCLDPPAVPIRFVLPPTGGVVVDVEPSSAPELLDHGGLSLGEVHGGERSFQERFRGEPVTFAWVGLGRDFEVALHAPAGRRGPFALRGPQRAGEVARFTIPAWDAPTLRARLVDAEGRPLPRTVVEIVIDTAEGEVARATTAEAEGLLAVALPPECRGRALRAVDLVVRFGPLDRARARVDGSGQRLDGVVDLGDVAPALPELWAEGRCVDDRGLPMNDPAFLDLPVAVIEAAAGAAPPELRKLDDGRIELRGGAGVRRVRIAGGRMLTAPRAAQLAPVELERGAQGFEVRFARLGSLDVELVHEPGRTCAVDVALWSASGARYGAFPFPRAFERGSRYRIEGLEPGRYRCTVTPLGARAPVLAVDDVEIAPGTNADPRLLGAVLPGVRVLRIEVVDDRGAPRDDIREASVYVRDGEQWLGRWFLGARVDVGVRAAAVDVTVVVPGFRPVRRDDVRADLAVRLEPLATLPVQVEVVGGTAPKGFFEVRAVPAEAGAASYTIRDAQGVERESAAPWLGPVTLAPGATAAVPVDGPGRHRLEVGWRALPAPAVPVDAAPAVVEVGPVPALCVIRVDAARIVR